MGKDFWFKMPRTIVIDFHKWLVENDIKYELDHSKFINDVQFDANRELEFHAKFLIKIFGDDEQVLVKLRWGEYGYDEPTFVILGEE